MARRALITGATGFLGGHLIQALDRDGWTLTALVRSRERWRAAGPMPQRVEVLEADLGSDAPPSGRLEAVDVVFHLAAAGTHHRPTDTLEELLKVNVLGTQRAIELARCLQARRFIYLGSCAEYGAGSFLTEDQPLAPRSLYGISKAAAGQAAQVLGPQAGLEVVWLRAFTPFGSHAPAGSLMADVIHHALEGRDIPLTAGDQRRDFLYVDDLIEALKLAAVHSQAAGRILNVCTGRETSVRDVVDLILRVMGHPVRPLFGALPYRHGEPGSVSGHPGNARQVLGWTAKTSLETGVRQTVEGYRQRHHAAAAALTR